MDLDKFAAGEIRSRQYRNRRIGEFFKEIELSEKQSTGITKILRTLEYNGSPPPEFETVDERVYLITTIKIRDGFETINGYNNGNLTQNNERSLSEVLTEKEKTQMSAILTYLNDYDSIDNAKGRELTGKSATTVRRYFGKLCEVGMLKPKGMTKDTIYTKVTE